MKTKRIIAKLALTIAFIAGPSACVADYDNAEQFTEEVGDSAAELAAPGGECACILGGTKNKWEVVPGTDGCAACTDSEDCADQICRTRRKGSSGQGKESSCKWKSSTMHTGVKGDPGAADEIGFGEF